MRPSRILAAAAAVLALSLASCRSPEQKLADARREQRASLDALYAAYAGGASGGEPGREAPRDAGFLGRMIGEVGRAYFEQQCLAEGRGERPLALSAKLEAFLVEPPNARACRRAADLQIEIDGLERELAALR